MRRFRTAVLLSGSGSNFAALADRSQSDETFLADLQFVVSNRPGVMGLARAEKLNIKTATIDHREFAGRDGFDAELHRTLVDEDIEFICLAGFMRILTAGFVKQWTGRMLNIHPSLLPAFRGNRAHEQVLASSVSMTGCTVHSVTPDLDAGPIVGQAAVPRLDDDDIERLSDRVRLAEHALYPAAVQSFLRENDQPLEVPSFEAGMLTINPQTRYSADNV